MTVETKRTIADPRLKRDVINLEQAVASAETERLEETLQLALENGYWLVGIEDDPSWETRYVLKKHEVDV